MKNSYLLIFALLTSSVTFAEEEHREHGAHEHGHATLSIVSENNDLLLSIETPALNVFGFEHKPKSDQQKTVVSQAIKDLEAFNQLLIIDSMAECSLTKFDVESPFDSEGEHGHDDEHEEDHAHDNEHKDTHAKEEQESSHSDVDINISFSCNKLLKLKQIDFAPLFKRFPELIELDAQTIVNGQQSATEISNKQPILVLTK